jgi:hypothetical protein
MNRWIGQVDIYPLFQATNCRQVVLTFHLNINGCLLVDNRAKSSTFLV